MVVIDQNQCIGCGLCARDCIANNITLQDHKATVKNECFRCGHCVAVCPRGAVSIPEYDMNDIEAITPDIRYPEPATLLHWIKARRSIRNYLPKEIEQYKLEMLLQAGRYTATAKNSQGCHFVFVQNELDTFKQMVWASIDGVEALGYRNIPQELMPYINFNRRRKENETDDYLFRNAPAVLYITSDFPTDPGLAAQNIELMANSMGLGALYNGFLARYTDASEELKKWLGIEGKTIRACMLLGYPNVRYQRTAPRKEANVVWK